MTKPLAKVFGASSKEPSPEPIKTRQDAANNVNSEADRVKAAQRAAAANPLQTGPEGVTDEFTGKRTLGNG